MSSRKVLAIQARKRRPKREKHPKKWSTSCCFKGRRLLTAFLHEISKEVLVFFLPGSSIDQEDDSDVVS
ncbi:SRSF protein kinase 2 [Homo sapiens]|uniref:SRSF protein kinase 2 n=1 Tax=Homo sapiens TaxID=9606 RepID=F8WAV6_HUMAN|nr:SRSF protein kinase 2 [Homo sapiens]KAI4015246.1 SRSF protein kinase 2 [Homo sapiens]